MTAIALLAAVLAVESLVRDRISRWPLTGPMLFVGAGILLGADGLNALDLTLEAESVSLAAELTLALLLFSDAARINTMALRHSYGVPLRLLGIGLPLTVALGTLMTGAIFSDLSWSEAALIAAILAPTDAALGQAVVANERVPVLVRQSLNVESGLNDGLVVPAVALFAILADGGEIDGPWTLVIEAVSEIGIGIAVGIAIGWLIGMSTRLATEHDWTDAAGARLVTFGGAVAGFGLATWLGGNGFIAAFVAGLVLHIVSGESACHRSELAEDAGQIGAATTFVLFGALMVVPAFDALSWPVALCALATLTLGRMVPVAIALIGAGFKWPTKLCFGWFGPRGLASMLFGLLIVAERGSDQVDDLFAIVSLVVLASVVLHGITAAPVSERYARWYDAQEDDNMMEAEPMPNLQLRGDRPFD